MTQNIQFQQNSLKQTHNKSFQISQIYQQTQFVDARDSQGDWRVGYIVEKDQKTKFFKIRFDGWPAKWDQYYKFNSNKLQHFRTIILGYTGQKIYPAIRPTWKFVLAEHISRLQQLKKFMQIIRPTADPHFMTQYLRGKHYLYIDFLLGNTYQSQESLIEVLDYLKYHLTLMKQYIDSIDTSFKKYYRSLQIKDESIVVDSESAYCSAFYQIFDASVSIFGGYNRLNSFYKDNKDLLLQILNEKLKNDEDFEEYIQIIFLKQFQDIGGWNSLMTLLEKLREQKVLIPFVFLKSLFSLFSQIDKINNNNFKKYLEILYEIYCKNINKITDKQIKDLDVSIITEMIEIIKELMNRVQSKEDKVLYIQKTQIEISYKFLKSPYFDKKLKGITTLKQLFENIVKSNNYIITPNQFFIWAQKINFFKEIFGDSMHIQILKRANQIFKLFCQTKLIDRDIIQIIWSSREGKHEAVIKAIDQLISDLVYYLSNQMTDFLFKKISSIKIQDWDSDFLELVKNFTSKALKRSDSAQNTYGLQLLYQNASKKQDSKSLMDFFQVLNSPILQYELGRYRNICIQNISKNTNSNFHINLLLKIQKETNVIIHLQQKITKIIYQDLIRYSKTYDHLQTRFNLLDILLTNHKQNIGITNEIFQRLWEQFKIKQNKGSKFFLSWICKYEQNTYKINSIFSQELKNYIFKNILCNSKKIDFFTFDQFQCEMFLVFFIDFNLNVGNLIMAKNSCKFKIRKYNDIVGLQQIWNIFLNCKNEEVIKRTAQFICDIHCKFTNQLEKQKKEIGLELVKKNIAYISKSQKTQNFRLIKNCILLLLKFINKIQGKFQQTNNQKIKVNIYRDIPLINSQTNQKREIRFNIGQPLGCLKNQISQLLNRPIRGIKLQQKSITIGNQSDHITYYSCGITPPIFYTFIEYEQNFVKQEINNNLELLFTLLSTQVSNHIWKLLSQLPTSPQFKNKIEKAENWDQLLTGGIYRQLYIMRIIQTLKGAQWTKFVKAGGIKTLLKKITMKVTSYIQKQYIKSVLVQLYKALLLYYNKNAQIEFENLGDLIEKLLLILINISFESKKEQNQVNSTEIEKQISSTIFLIINKIKKEEDNMNILSILLKSDIVNLFRFTMIQSDNILLKDLVCNQIRKILIEQQIRYPNQFKQLSIIILDKIFLISLQTISKKTLKFFNLCSNLIEFSDSKIFIQIMDVLPNFINNLINLFYEHPGQKSSREPNQIFDGIINVLRSMLMKKDISISNKQKLLYSVLNDCLFNIQDYQKGPKSKTYVTRYSTYKLLLVLMLQNQQYMIRVIDFLKKFHLQGQWRTKKVTQWTITSKTNQKSLTGYVGLKNLGCICYMNSFLQQMFMIPTFRDSILQIDDPLYNQLKEEDNVLYQLKTMFIALQRSQQQYYNPKAFCHAFKNYQGKPTNLAEQMDIDQFSGFFFDKLENQIKNSKNGNIIKNHFGGIFSNQIICKGCPHFSERQQAFLSISLQVKNKSNIYQSLQTMIKGQMLQGDNAYYCDRCNKKVPALKRVCLKQLPNHLIIVLKRFEFNYETMTKLKINDFCQFPNELNLSQYSQQNLRKKQSTYFQQEDQFSKQYFEYELRGVVIHMGFADSGHYYSYIQKRDTKNEWFEFNDTLVRKFDPQNLANQAFGGQQKTYEITSKQKIRNAYILIYDRKNLKYQRIIKKDEKIEYCEKFIEQLKIENERYSINKLLFSKEYQDFVRDIFNVKNPSQKYIQLVKFSITFFLTRTIREKQKKSTYQFLNAIKIKLNQYQEISSWILEVFSQENSLFEFFKNNPSKQIRRILANFVVQVAEIRYNLEGKGAVNRLFQTVTNNQTNLQQPKTILANFINALIRFIGQQLGSNMNQIFLILFKISKFGQQTAQYLLSKQTIGIILQQILERPKKILYQRQKLPVIQQKQLLGNSFDGEGKETELQKKIQIISTRTDYEKTYMWAFLSQLIKHCNLKTEKKYQVFQYQTNFSLGDYQMNLIYLNSDYVFKMIEEARNKFLIRSVSLYLCVLAIQNLKFTQQLIKSIGKAFKNLQAVKFRSFFVLFKQLINITDKFQDRRIQLGLNQVNTGHEQNKKYYIQTDIIQQWIIKIARKSKKLQNHMRVYDSLARNILNNLKQKSAPSQQFTLKHRQPCDRMTHILHGIQLPKSVPAYLQLTKIKQKALNSILNGQQLPFQEWDSDDDLTQKPIIAGQKISLYVQAGLFNFVEATILSFVYDSLTIEYKNDKTHLWKDDENLTTLHKVNTVDDIKKEETINLSDETASNEEEGVV